MGATLLPFSSASADSSSADVDTQVVDGYAIGVAVEAYYTTGTGTTEWACAAVVPEAITVTISCYQSGVGGNAVASATGPAVVASKSYPAARSSICWTASAVFPAPFSESVSFPGACTVGRTVGQLTPPEVLIADVAGHLENALALTDPFSLVSDAATGDDTESESPSPDLLAPSASLIISNAAITAGDNCPEVLGSPNPKARSHIVYEFYDPFGCVIPLRLGYAPHNWGAAHIRYENSLGKKNHCLTPECLQQIQAALIMSSYSIDDDYRVYAHRYRDRKSNAKRTRCVWVDFKDYITYNRKGIITAFSKAGWLDPWQCEG